MSENKIEKVIKISDLNAKKSNEINRIAYKSTYLVPCEVDIKEEEVNFTYDLNNLEILNIIKERKTVEKLRIAINVSNMFCMLDEYSFKLEPNNLYYDYNYNVKVLERDIKLEEEIIDYKDMVLQYKSLIGYLFDEKHSYDDFYKGGLDLIKSNKKIEKYLELNDINEIKEELLLDLKKQEKDDRENYIEVRSRSLKIKKYSIITMGIMIVGLLTYVVYNAIFLNPFNQNIIKANNYYMDQDYEGVIKCLETTRGLKLDKESKYKLAYSYIISENLSDKQKKNITTNLNTKSDENILDYWIALGKSNYDKAIDLAKKVQDDELILYALLNKDKYIQDNNKMTGEEKQKQQETLKSEIEKLTKALKGNDTFQRNSVNEKANEKANEKVNEKVDSTNVNPKDASNQGIINTQESKGLNLVPSSN